MLRSITDYNFHNKRTLLRCDFNVPIENGKILEDFKIQSALFTIKYLKMLGAKIIILSHLGRTSDYKNKKQKAYTLKPVFDRLQELLKEDITFISDAISLKAKKAVKKMKSGDIIMLENLRFYKGEEENNISFAEKLSELGDVYVGEHFSVCHRTNASIVALPKMMPRFAGSYFLKEFFFLLGI